MSYKIKKFLMSNGERGCLILDKETQLPVYYQNLYLTTNVRNRSATASTIEIVATNLLILSNFLKSRNINIINRIEIKGFLSVAEVDDLIRYARQRFDKQKITNVRVIKMEQVAKRTFSYRIHVFSSYLNWLCGLLHSIKGIHARYEVESFIESIRAHLPRNKSLSVNNRKDKSLSEEQIKTLFKLLEVEGSQNPFQKEVQVRNRLIFTLLLNCGLRAGELLNLKVNDFNPRGYTLNIFRRHDCIEDRRLNQPLVKTGEREIPLSDELAMEILDYINNYRNKYTKKKKHDFLFVTHSSCKTTGEPLSVSAYEKIISTIKKSSPVLKNLSGHKLRHSWNYFYSNEIDDSNLDISRKSELRCYLMGWSKHSKMSENYNFKHISIKEKEVIERVYDSLRKITKEV
ncbi:TPA: site-specific integrase [Escherichia coli]|uniref:tyrosine-type recombinase/integrase n=1 Tax=Escherichia coli TaxID=562 RepID=UPI0010222409|nr:site-specific integrase [Escherichia coli]HAN8821471.1 site-specific integrase [Escherichia coli]HAO7052358.1 site-specific integrase [Escherichia coli]